MGLFSGGVVIEDVAFTFDPKQFMTGVNQMTKSLDAFTKKTQETGTKSDKNISKANKGMPNLMSGFLKLGAIVGVAMLGIKALGKGVPEIGRSFMFAGEIITKNLLMPLRRELVPLLMKMLNWVRDNRTMFLKMGNVIASVFRVAVTIVKQLFELVSNTFKRIFTGLQEMFGKTTATITEVVNLVLFKISAVAIFIMTILQPVFDWLVDALITVIGWVKEYTVGFADGFGDLSPVFDNFIDSIKSVMSSLDRLGIKGESVLKIFRTFGIVIGGIVKGVMTGLVEILDQVGLGIGLLVNSVKKLSALKNGDKEYNLANENDKLLKDYAERSKQRGAILVETVKNVGTKTGETWSTPDSSNISNSNSSSSSVQNNDVKIIINGTDNPKAVSKEVNSGLTEILKDQRNRTGD
jgi:hypothetical protein